MDLSAIRAKLDSMNNSGNDRQKVDYEKIFWKPQTGSQQIRIVPSVYNPNYPFKELFFHYGVGKYPMIALSNFGEQDPVVEFVNELKKTSDKDNWSLAGKLSPKMRIFAPVIVRGEEDMGVRLWGFGKNVYKSLMAYAADEEIGDFTDVISGRDFTVEVVQGNPYPETTIRPRMKESALSENNTLVESWLKTQPKAEDSFTKYDFDFIKRQLAKYLDPDAEDGDDTPVATQAAPTPTVAAPAAVQAPANNFTVNNATAGKPDTAKKFDDLFSDDDLPF